MSLPLPGRALAAAFREEIVGISILHKKCIKVHKKLLNVFLPERIRNHTQIRKHMNRVSTFSVCCTLLVVSSLAGQNLLINPGLNMGPDNLEGYNAFAVWSKGPDGFGSPWGLADAPVVAPGDGTATFGMNDQLATADAFWTGASQVMVFQQDFWTPDNNAGVPAGALDYGDSFIFSGNAVISEAYAAGNTGEVFIQFLDKGYSPTFLQSVDLTSLSSDGAFSLSAMIPSDADLNIVQVGFRNSGIEGTLGEMTVSNLSVVRDEGLAVIPEPSALGLLVGLCGLALAARRRR
ncbi:MAG: PEP-CTERM sorting domain-containing protein [Verrucomicrobiota bacterium]